MSIIVTIALATICFDYRGANECHPVLLGKNSLTPPGEYVLQQRRILAPGYGGDILQFKETETDLYSIHRIWTLIPSQKRRERLKSSNVQDHYISSGCVNVDEETYAKLVDCCSRDALTIK